MPTETDIQLESIVSRTPSTLSNTVDDETVLLDVAKSSYYGLGPVAGRIWSALAEPVMVSAVVDHLLDEYEVSRAECERDVLIFLRQLYVAGLLLVRAS
ncbi:MAG: PqqD family peptide modification chaperone [Desulfobulbaceae bacterium]|jgi:hypothetical protein|nr:PqqD family peptide modification chaperone [Desulfobulbaceae bacterium]